MKIDPFTPADMKELLERPSEACMREALSNEAYIAALAKHEAWTLRIGGVVMACAGIVPMWPGRFELWAVVASDIGRIGMLRLHRAVQRFLETRHGRLEACVVAHFEAARRWVELLGFHCDTPRPMTAYLPDGSDAYLYSRVG